MKIEYGSILSWAISLIARALDTTPTDILKDAKLQTLRDSLMNQRYGFGAREGIEIAFCPLYQTIRFECGRKKRADEVTELIRARWRRGNIIVIPVPESLIDRKWSESNPPGDYRIN
jgi:hypothetical protein